VEYVSDALVIMTASRIPTDLVKDFSAVPAEQRFEQLSASTLSRTSLLRITREVPELGMVLENLSPAQTLEYLRRHIELRFDRSADPLAGMITVSYSGPTQKIAKAVTTKVLKTMSETNSRQVEIRVFETQDFLAQRLRTVADQLEEQGERIAHRSPSLAASAKQVQALDYELLQSTYRALYAKHQEVVMAANLESQQRGARVEVVDPPNDGFPVEPNRD
jgi:hypothetical protein